MKKILALVLACMMLLSVSAFAEEKDPASYSGKVMMYSSAGEDIVLAIKEAFEAKYPNVTLDYYAATSGKCVTKLATEIQAELNKWTSEVTPILGEVDTLVLAKKSDISDGNSYSGTKYETLRDFGFQYYMGFSSAGGSWADITNEYFRQGRVLVMGSTMKYTPGWFEGMFKVDSVLDTNRGSIPKPA